MLHNFGKVHSLPHSKGRTDFQLNFVATSHRNSLIVISMVADDLKAVVNTLVTYIYMPCHRCITFLSMHMCIQVTRSYNRSLHRPI